MTLQLNEYDASDDVYKANAAVIGRNHCNRACQEIDSSDLATVRVVSMLILDVDAAE